jgi:abortive infection bacteriophage resistance protein
MRTRGFIFAKIAPRKMASRTFTKQALLTADLLQFLIDKGLIVADRPYAEHSLSYVGYYRLKIYTRHFEDAGKKFRAGTTFENIIEVYEFDRALRLLCLDAIEKVEVALRAHIVNEMGAVGTPHFYYREEFFETKSSVTKMRSMGEKANHLSITHYRFQYSEPFLPPIWCLTEASTFGQLSTLFADLALPHRKRIAKGFGFDEEVCVSWFRSISTLRNICAHHGRLWDARLPVNTPRKARAYAGDLADNSRCYARAVVLQALLKEKIDYNGNHGWGGRFKNFIANRPATISLSDMGFPPDWDTRALWN